MTRSEKKALLDLLALGIGGVVGALVTRWLEQTGMEPTAAALGVMGVGGVGVMVGERHMRALAGGFAAAGGGQLASQWLKALDRRLATAPSPETRARRNAERVAEMIERVFAGRRLESDQLAASGQSDEVAGDVVGDEVPDDRGRT